MDNLKIILNKLKNPVILVATLANIYGLLETFEVLNFCNVDETTYMKIVNLVVAILLQVGVLKNVAEKEEEEEE